MAKTPEVDEKLGVLNSETKNGSTLESLKKKSAVLSGFKYGQSLEMNSSSGIIMADLVPTPKLSISPWNHLGSSSELMNLKSCVKSGGVSKSFSIILISVLSTNTFLELSSFVGLMVKNISLLSILDDIESTSK